MQKILLDTDIGSDIDDSIALTYLLCQPACELVGITTVSGEPEKRARLASAICRAAGKDIPIFAGTGEPMLTKQLQPRAPQADDLSAWPHETAFAPNGAVTFMRDIIYQNPGEITLLVIGPLTNVALLFLTYPETAKLLKSVVLMSGNFYNKLDMPMSEWNVRCDPFASKVVYDNRDLKALYAVGLDATLQVQLRPQEVYARFTAPVLAPVLPYVDKWCACCDGTVTFHDPLAAACLFDDTLCSFERGTVEVETASERCGGVTYFTPSEQGPHFVAKTVDAPRFFEHYFSVVK